VAHFEITLLYPDGTTLPFHTGDLEPVEIGSMIVVVTKLMRHQGVPVSVLLKQVPAPPT
jgi:hypothetical protein